MHPTELKKSHIIPKFAFDYFKKTGGKYMRTYENPNVRVQDGIKKYLLGEKAEQEFSKRERWFANNIFFPYQKEGKSLFKYDENLSYFMISVLWRVLVEQLSHSSVKEEKRLDFLNEVKEVWRLFLSKYQYPINYDNLNIFLTDRVLPHNTTNLYNVDSYMSRTIDATIIVNNDYSTVGIYAKFLRFMMWSIVRGRPSNGKNIKIEFGNGKLKTPQILEDYYISKFIKHRIKITDEREMPNEKQQEKIISELRRTKDKIWRSDAGLSMINDFENRKKASR